MADGRAACRGVGWCADPKSMSSGDDYDAVDARFPAATTGDIACHHFARARVLATIRHQYREQEAVAYAPQLCLSRAREVLGDSVVRRRDMSRRLPREISIYRMKAASSAARVLNILIRENGISNRR